MLSSLQLKPYCELFSVSKIMKIPIGSIGTNKKSVLTSMSVSSLYGKVSAGIGANAPAACRSVAINSTNVLL